MPRTNTATAAPPRPHRAARSVLVAHAIDGTTYHTADEHGPAGWSARCACGAGTGATRYATREDVLAAHRGHVRRYLPAGSR